MEESQIFFRPWKGKDYANSKIDGKRVLVLGHTYPCNEKNLTKVCDTCGVKPLKKYCRSVTTKSINEYRHGKLKIRHANTFRAFEKALIGNECSDIWDSLIFYNYVQKAFVNPDGRTGKCPMDYYRRSFEPLVNVLLKYQPKYVIVWGKPNHDFVIKLFKDNGYKVESFNEGNDFVYEKVTIGVLQIYFLRMQHPSMEFKPDFWHEKIELFLNLD